MRNWILLVISALLAVFIFATLTRPLSIGGTTLPPLIRVLSPFTGFLANAENTNKMAEEISIQLDGLDGPVKIVFDDRMVPHIFAKSTEDALMVQGYIHAEFRLFQMQLSSKATAGELSEILGDLTLNYDKRTRRRGMGYAAENAVSSWNNYPETIALIEAYCEGVNSKIKEYGPRSLPIEFKILDFKPEKWTIDDIALIYKGMAFDLSYKHDDYFASAALEVFGQKTFDFLFPLRSKKEAPIVPTSNTSQTDELIGPVPAPVLDIGKSKNEYDDPMPSPFIGSNNWAISGKKSVSGNPILCNDPHLGLSLPSIWYEMHIVTPEMNVYGVSIPGTPGIILGFNENIAWGSTNGSQDVLNWYEIEWQDKSKGAYIVDGQTVFADPRVEKIKVRGEKKVIDTVWYTVFGPVSTLGDNRDFAMQWLAHKDFGKNDIATFLGFDRSRNYDDFQDALANYTGPIQNFVFASKDGDIAINVQGYIPIRSENESKFLQKGDKRQKADLNIIPQDDLPSIKNPARNFVSSANQISVDSTYPYDIYGYYDAYRGRIINKYLGQKKKMSVEDMMTLQTSNHSLEPIEFFDLIDSLISDSDLDKKERSFLNELKIWNGSFDAESELPYRYKLLLNRYFWGVWDEYKSDSLKNVLIPDVWRTIEISTTNPNHPFFDDISTESVESARDIMIRSISKASFELDSLKKTGTSLRWSDRKKSRIDHLARIPGLGEKLDVGGYGGAPNAMRETTGPSWRMVVEMGDEINAWGVYPGGQSGNPGSPYYSNSVDTWANGQYHKLKLYNSENEIDNWFLKVDCKPKKQ